MTMSKLICPPYAAMYFCVSDHALFEQCTNTVQLGLPNAKIFVQYFKDFDNLCLLSRDRKEHQTLESKLGSP